MGPPVARIALRADENNDIFLLLLADYNRPLFFLFPECYRRPSSLSRGRRRVQLTRSLRVLFLSGPFYTYLKAINPQEEKKRLLEHRGPLRFNLRGSASATQPVPVFVEQPEGDARRAGGVGRGVLPLGRREDLLDRHIAPPPRLPLVLLVVVAVVTHPQR